MLGAGDVFQSGRSNRHEELAGCRNSCSANALHACESSRRPVIEGGV